ncbi:hypothetical protein GCM10009790_37040 [Georgenia ruanii]
MERPGRHRVQPTRTLGARHREAALTQHTQMLRHGAGWEIPNSPRTTTGGMALPGAECNHRGDAAPTFVGLMKHIETELRVAGADIPHQ